MLKKSFRKWVDERGKTILFTFASALIRKQVKVQDRKNMPSKHFNVGSTLLLGWYDIATSHNAKSTLKQRCTSTLKFTTFKNVETTFCISTLNWTTLDNVETALLFSTSIFYNVGQRRDNVANMAIWKKKLSLDSKAKQYFWASRNMLDSKSYSVFPHFKGNL